MNKGLKKMAVLMLALLVALIPTTAMAEQVAMKSLELSNPVVSMNGIEVANLEGLKVRLSGAAEEDTLVGLVELLAGDKSAAEAVVEFDGRWLNVKAEGISSAYGLPLLKMLEAQGISMEEIDLELASQYAAILEGFSEENLARMGERMVAFSQEWEDALLADAESGDPEEVAFPDGKIVSMDVLNMTLTKETICDLYAGVFEILLSNPAFAGIWQIVVQEAPEYAGMDAEALVGALFEEVELSQIPYVYRYEESGQYAYMTFSFEMEDSKSQAEQWVYPAEENKTAVEMVVRMEPTDPAYAGEYVTMEMDLLMDLAEPDFMEMDMRMHGNLSGNEGDLMELTAHEYPVGYEGRQDGEFYLDMFANMDGEAAGLTLSANYTPADYIESDCDRWQASMRFLGDGSFISMDGTYAQAGDEADRVYSALDYSYSGMGEEDAFYYEYDAIETPNALGGQDQVGTLVLGGGSQGVEGAISVDVALTDSMVDAERLSFEGMDVVNIMAMTSKDGEEFIEEIGALGTRLAMVLMGNVPGLQELYMQSLEF